MEPAARDIIMVPYIDQLQGTDIEAHSATGIVLEGEVVLLRHRWDRASGYAPRRTRHTTCCRLRPNPFSF